jgi:4-amino-4-deoxy-L-arabinose transferase-like glycosyltransferase
MSFLGVLALSSAVSRFDRRWGQLLLWLLCAIPFDAFYEGRQLSEPLATAFLALGFSVPVIAREWRGRWFASGVLLGLAVLTRDVYILLVPFVALIAALGTFGTAWRVTVARPAAILLGAALVILPWTYRNCALADQCSVVSRGGLGFTLWIGTWERDGLWWNAKGADFPDYAFDRPEERADAERWFVSPDVEARSRFFGEMARRRIVQDPLRWIVTCVRRFPRLWVGTRSDLFALQSPPFTRGSVPWYAFKLSCFGTNILVLLFGLAGALMTIKRCRFCDWLWAAAPILYTGGVYFVLHNTETRYSQPVFQFLIAFASFALLAAYDSARRRFGFQVEGGSSGAAG